MVAITGGNVVTVWFGLGRRSLIVSVGYFFSFSSSHALVIIWGWLQLTEWSQTETYRRDVLTKKERKKRKVGNCVISLFLSSSSLSLKGDGGCRPTAQQPHCTV